MVSSIGKFARFLYISHFLSAWGNRLWEFAAALLLIKILPGSVLLPSIFGIAESGIAVLFAGFVGEWIDRNRHDRLKVIRRSLLWQNISIAISAGFAVAYLVAKTDVEQSVRYVLVSGVIIFGSLASLAAVGSTIAVEKDWVTTLAAKDSRKLSAINSNMKRIDLLCKIAAPIVASVVIQLTDYGGAIAIAAWNMVVLPIEYFLMASVYHQADVLQSPSSKPSAEGGESSALLSGANSPSYESGVGSAFQGAADTLSDAPPAELIAELEDPLKSSKEETGGPQLLGSAAPKVKRACARNPLIILIRGWDRWWKQKIMMPAAALALLYLTVLSFGSLMTAYLHWANISFITLAIMRGAGALCGLSSTLLFSCFRHRYGSARTGTVAIISQLVLLLLAFPAALYSIAPYAWDLFHWEPVEAETTPPPLGIAWALMVGVSASRFGLWLFDLTVNQMLQEDVDDDERGIVNGVQNSLQNLLQVGSYVLGAIITQPYHFGYLILASLFMVLIASICYFIFACRVGCGHKPEN